MLPKVFGVTGQMRHGKDTLAAFMAEAGGLQVMHFADRLKEICRDVYSLNDEQLHGGLKDLAIVPIELDNQLDALRQITGLSIAPRGMVAHTPRQVLQFIGTEYVRNTSRTYWVDYLLEQIRLRGGNVVVADVRFPNECFELQQLGACCVRVVRQGVENAYQHASEAQIASLRVDMEFVFPEGRLDLIRAVAAGLVTLGDR